MSGRMRGLFRGTLIYGVGQALSRSMALLLLPLLTAYLAPSAYGLLAVLTAFGLLLHTVFSVGLGAALAPSYFEERGGQDRAATIWTALVILCVSIAVMMALTAAAPWRLAEWMLGDAAYGGLVLLAAGATAFSILTIPLRQFLMFEERPGLYVVLSLASVGVSIALTVWLVVGLDRGLRGVLEADLAGQALACVLLAVPVIRSGRFEIRRTLARDLLTLGIPLIPAFASLFLLQHGSRYILQWIEGPAAVGVYAVGINIAAAVGLFVAGFQSAWMPYFMAYAKRPGEASRALGRAATYYVFGVGTISLLMYIFARAAVLVLAAPGYEGAHLVVGVGASTQFLSGLFLVLLPGMYFAGEVRYLGIVQALAAAAAIALNLALIPVWGYVGSAVAVLLSYLLLILAQYAWNSRRGYTPVAYEWRRLRAFAVLYVVVAAASFLPRELGLAAELLVASAAGAGVVLLIARLLDPQERGMLRGVLTRTTRGAAADPPGGPRVYASNGSAGEAPEGVR